MVVPSGSSPPRGGRGRTRQRRHGVRAPLRLLLGLSDDVKALFVDFSALYHPLQVRPPLRSGPVSRVSKALDLLGCGGLGELDVCGDGRFATDEHAEFGSAWQEL